MTIATIEEPTTVQRQALAQARSRIPTLRATAEQMCRVLVTGPEFADLRDGLSAVAHATGPAAQIAAVEQLERAIERWRQSAVLAEQMNRAPREAAERAQTILAELQREIPPALFQQRIEAAQQAQQAEQHLARARQTLAQFSAQVTGDPAAWGVELQRMQGAISGHERAVAAAAQRLAQVEGQITQALQQVFNRKAGDLRGQISTIETQARQEIEALARQADAVRAQAQQQIETLERQLRQLEAGRSG